MQALVMPKRLAHTFGRETGEVLRHSGRTFRPPEPDTVLVSEKGGPAKR